MIKFRTLQFTIPLVLSAMYLGPVVAEERPCAFPEPCEIKGANGGTYYLGFPKDWNGKDKLKPFVFFHGHNGSGAGVVKNKGLVSQLAGQGFVLVAPDGPMFNFRGRSARGWAARPEEGLGRGGRSDIAFVDAVLEDVAAKLPTIEGKTAISGFSSGGSMAWYYGCYSNTKIDAIVAVAGGLRRPLPEGGVKQADGSVAKKCPAGPQRLLHIHGFKDRQVPLEGRGIRAWHQGDVFEGLAVMRHTNQCGSRPDKAESEGRFWCRTWNKCTSGIGVRMCLHGGGHGMPKGWLDEAFRWISPPKS